MLHGWYGKLIGVLVGYLIGRGWLGAVVGLVLGHQFDVMSRRNRRVPGGDPRATGIPGGAAADPATLSRAFFETTFLVMGHVAKSDGRVTEQEIDAARAAMQRFSLGDADRRRAIELFSQGKAAGFPLEPTLERLRQMAGGHADLCRMFVQIQLQAALQGNGIGDRPRSVLQRMCRVLGISPLEFASLEAMLRLRARSEGYGRQSQGSASGARPETRLADAYEVIGVPAAATDAEVTRAFRRLMSQNHPDKLVAQGLPESMVAAAHERTQRILEAYEIVKTQRGMR
jgi:DnaJ like chaperone protein